MCVCLCHGRVGRQQYGEPLYLRLTSIYSHVHEICFAYEFYRNVYSVDEVKWSVNTNWIVHTASQFTMYFHKIGPSQRLLVLSICRPLPRLVRSINAIFLFQSCRLGVYDVDAFEHQMEMFDKFKIPLPILLAHHQSARFVGPSKAITQLIIQVMPSSYSTNLNIFNCLPFNPNPLLVHRINAIDGFNEWQL